MASLRLNCTPPDRRRLEQLRDDLGKPTLTAVIRHCLLVVKRLADHCSKPDCHVQLVHADGTLERFSVE